jgi:GNAT superfamily N-acetyltransferase
VNIRAAVPGDERSLAVLNGVVQQLHVAGRPDFFKPTQLDEVAAWFRPLLRKPTAGIWLAEDDGVPIGYVLAFVRERAENPFCPSRRWCEIDQIAVRPDRQRQGVGRALIEQALTWARAEGAGDIELSTWSFNDSAQRMFRGVGFVTKIVRFELEPPGARRPMAPGGLVIPEDSPLFTALATLARDARLVFFAGLPGTGKSLLIHQLAHLAHAHGRRIHLLQWDVARPVFEASDAGRRYPQAGGVTHGVIRLAVGRWARRALARWHAQHAGSDDLLIGETPLIGHRLIELTRPADDEAEPLLSAESARFVIPVPSRALREHLESERSRRARDPLHRREQEDAPPEVLRDLWRELVGVARTLGIAGPAAHSKDLPYDSVIYQRVYEHLLAHRHTEALPLDTRLPTEHFSAYEFKFPAADLIPAEPEAERFIRQVEADYTETAAVEREIERWYR